LELDKSSTPSILFDDSNFKEILHPMEQELSSTLEDYLIAVYRLEGEKRVARPRDIGRLQNVAKSTVTAALKSLAERGLINYEPYETITLTSQGRQTAERLAIRNRILRDFLEGVLGLDPEQAGKTACGMEHAVEEEAMERFVCFLAFVKQHPPDGTKWLDGFREFIRQGGRSRIYRKCVEEYLKAL
jgi:DtxR family Mn-dependent transcriptional regulator